MADMMMRGMQVAAALVGLITAGCAHDLESVDPPCDDRQSCQPGKVCQNGRCVVADAAAPLEASTDGPVKDLGGDAPPDKTLPDAPVDVVTPKEAPVDQPAQDAAKPDLDQMAVDLPVPDAPPDQKVPDAAIPDAAIPDAAPKTTPTGLCSKDKWCHENPIPHSTGYSSVWAHSPTNVFAVANKLITHYDGKKVSVVHTSATTLHDVWGTSPSDVYACGITGSVLKYDGSKWTSISMATSAGTLNAIWGTSGTNLYAAGAQGKVFRYSGLYWGTETIPTTATAPLNAIWGSGAKDIYAVGEKGTALRYNGKEWKKLTPPTTSSTIHDVWGSGPTNVFFAVSHSKGNYLRFDGNYWSSPAAVDKTKTIYSFWGSGPTNVYAAGVFSFLARFNGSSWSNHTPGAYLHFKGISGSGAGFVVLAGDRDGVLLKFDGKYFAHMHDNVWGNPLWAVWGSSPTDIYAGGDNKMLHNDGKSWKAMSSDPAHSVYAIWGSDPTTVFAAGTGSHFSRLVGGKWVKVLKGTTKAMYGIWGTSATNVYMVGNGGTVIRIQAAGVSASVPYNNGHSYVDVWGTGPTNVYVVGKQGVIVHTDGTTWSQIKKFTTATMTADLSGIWGSSHSNIFVVGSHVAIHHDGTDWRVDTSGFVGCNALGGAWGSGPSDVFAPCSNGVVRHYVGKVHGGTKQWEVMDGWGPNNGVWGSGPSAVWMVGPGGRILSYKPKGP